jgi:hypothetical protein
MTRRTIGLFLALALLIVLLTAAAQPPGKVPRLGILAAGSSAPAEFLIYVKLILTLLVIEVFMEASKSLTPEFMSPEPIVAEPLTPESMSPEPIVAEPMTSESMSPTPRMP